MGAKGDGRTDDTNALQAAIDRARAEGGGRVWLPPGIFCTSTLTLPGGVAIQGCGWQSILRLRSGANVDLIVTPTGRTSYYGVVQDLCLDGNRSHNNRGCGIRLHGAINYRIEAVKLVGFAGSGIMLGGASGAPTIAPWILNCGVYECGGAGIDRDAYCTDVKIHAVDIGRCAKGVVLPNSSFLSDVTIWQCVTGVHGYWAANAHLVQVRCERCRNEGFLFEGCTDISLESCRAYENNQSARGHDGFAFRGTKEHPCARISIVGCMSGLTGSKFEKQRFGFSDGGSEHVDYILCSGCAAFGNEVAGFDLAAGDHDFVSHNL